MKEQQQQQQLQQRLIDKIEEAAMAQIRKSPDNTAEQAAIDAVQAANQVPLIYLPNGQQELTSSLKDTVSTVRYDQQVMEDMKQQETQVQEREKEPESVTMHASATGSCRYKTDPAGQSA